MKSSSRGTALSAGSGFSKEPFANQPTPRDDRLASRRRVGNCFRLEWGRIAEEGYFADPLYGGNRDKVGWKLLGFPGVPSGQYRELATSSEAYHAEPVSVLDLQTGKVPVDAEGFPKHVIIKRNSNTNSSRES